MSVLFQSPLLLFIYVYSIGNFYEVKGLKLSYQIINKIHCPVTLKKEKKANQIADLQELNKPFPFLTQHYKLALYTENKA